MLLIFLCLSKQNILPTLILYDISFFQLILNLGYKVSRHRTLMNIFDKAPVVDKDVFLAPSASIIGDVRVGRGSSIWYGCVLRGKMKYFAPQYVCNSEIPFYFSF